MKMCRTKRQRIFCCGQAAGLMSIFLVWAGAGFGTITLTPFDITALMSSALTRQVAGRRG
jgi:hypothetical protein